MSCQKSEPNILQIIQQLARLLIRFQVDNLPPTHPPFPICLPPAHAKQHTSRQRNRNCQIPPPIAADREIHIPLIIGTGVEKSHAEDTLWYCVSDV